MRYFLHLTLITLIGFSVFSPTPVVAENSLNRESSLAEKAAKKAVDVSDKIADKVDAAANRIDLFLAGKKYTDKKNETQLELIQRVIWSEGGNIRTSTDAGLNLRLPNLEKRWQLRFSSYDEEEESRDFRRRRLGTAPEERNYGAAFLFFEKLGKIDATFQPRIELKDPLFMSYVLRFETDFKIESFHLIPRMDLFADAQKGTGVYFSLEYIQELSKRRYFTLHTDFEYRDHKNFFQSQQGLTLDQALDDTKGVGSSIIFVSNNRHRYHLDTLTLAQSFNHEVHPNRLLYSISPFITFAKPDHFKGDVGISLNIQVIF